MPMVVRLHISIISAKSQGSNGRRSGIYTTGTMAERERGIRQGAVGGRVRHPPAWLTVSHQFVYDRPNRRWGHTVPCPPFLPAGQLTVLSLPPSPARTADKKTTYALAATATNDLSRSVLICSAERRSCCRSSINIPVNPCRSPRPFKTSRLVVFLTLKNERRMTAS